MSDAEAEGRLWAILGAIRRCGAGTFPLLCLLRNTITNLPS
jgi:hypothetical protein